MRPTLFFIYNANSGLINGALDSLHKIVSPSTYPCKLCELTHGYFGQRSFWKGYSHQLNKDGYDMRFLHKDEMGDWPVQFSMLPAVYLYRSGHLELIAGPSELAEMKKGEELAELISKNLGVINISAGSNRFSLSR